MTHALSREILINKLIWFIIWLFIYDIEENNRGTKKLFIENNKSHIEFDWKLPHHWYNLRDKLNYQSVDWDQSLSGGLWDITFYILFTFHELYLTSGTLMMSVFINKHSYLVNKRQNYARVLAYQNTCQQWFAKCKKLITKTPDFTRYLYDLIISVAHVMLVSGNFDTKMSRSHLTTEACTK